MPRRTPAGRTGASGASVNVKLRGGYNPIITGRPSGIVSEVALAPELHIARDRRGMRYTPCVRAGAAVRKGQPLATCAIQGGTLTLTAPADGYVLEDAPADGIITIRTAPLEGQPPAGDALDPDRVDATVVRRRMAQHGIWPLLWSTRTAGMPALDADAPTALVVNTLLAEPFRARGNVILRRNWSRIVLGLQFLRPLAGPDGAVHLVLPQGEDPLEQLIREDLRGHAWIRFHRAPLRYPIENPRVMMAALRGEAPELTAERDVWIVDVQALEAVGTCLGEGNTLSHRTVALAGPAMTAPRHVSVTVGTPLAELLPARGLADTVTILRGGLFNGVPVDPHTTAVSYDDDAFLLLPRTRPREWLSFLHAGSSRRSALPCFFANLTGDADRQVSTLLRGERRPCIACGLCETYCPAGLMPQLLHRYLYGEDLDRAEQAGLALCVDCGLCTYVCPSKIDLHHEMANAKETLKHEADETHPSCPV